MAGEHVAQFRRGRAIPELHEIRARLEDWVSSLDLRNAEPDLPVEDRAADSWESLVAVADAAGGDWPERARAACIALTTGSEADADEGGPGERLLGDLYAIWHPVDEGDRPLDITPQEKRSTADLLFALKEIEEAPWADWAGGKGLTSRALSQFLKPFRVKPKKWSGGIRGYFYVDLIDAWARYRHPSAPSAQAPHEGQDLPGGIEESPVADGVADSDSTNATDPADSTVAGSGFASATTNATGDSPPSLTDHEVVADGADGADTHLKRATADGGGEEVF